MLVSPDSSRARIEALLRSTGILQLTPGKAKKELKNKGHSLKGATVTLIEHGDFACPARAQTCRVIRKLRGKRERSVRPARLLPAVGRGGRITDHRD